jgi:formylglycine-generating enzyme required for sulfatase activity
MGSEVGRPDERPVHSVVVRGFRLGTTPVTNAQYAGFVGAGHAPEPPFWRQTPFAAPDLPVVGITWFEAVAFAEWLGERLGGRWRLPSEQEWERAARGGLDEAPTAWGEGLPPGEVPEGPLEGPWPVGRGTPNGFGLLDPGTVVHEWCSDRYSPYALMGGPASSPLEASEAGSGKVIDSEPDRVVQEAGGTRLADQQGAAPLRRSSRGGSWRHRQRWSPPAARSSLLPELRYADYGFRVLLEEG